MMKKYYFFYGTQAVEIERPKVPDAIAIKGIKNIIGPSRTKAVILNVCNKAK